jgi:hypothetical protein
VFTWTGCCLGVHAGGGTMTSNTEGLDNNGKGAPPAVRPIATVRAATCFCAVIRVKVVLERAFGPSEIFESRKRSFGDAHSVTGLASQFQEEVDMRKASIGLVSRVSIAIVAASTPGFAQSPTATFACPGEATDTCFFAIFGPGFSGAMFELRGRQSKQVPAVAGRNTYCYGVNAPPASTCPKKPVTSGVNQ